MKQHFKLFIVSDGNQVVYERLSNDDDGEAISTTAYHSDGTRMQLKGNFGALKEIADAAFEIIDQKRAQDWYDAVTEMLNS